MPTHGAGRATFPEFWRVWRTLLEELERPGTALLVEGERDRRSARALGVRADVHLVHRGARLPSVANGLTGATRRVVVLTDWDSAGGELARRLRQLLTDGRLEVDLDTRRRLGLALRGEVVHLEGLHGWARRRAEETGRPLEEYLDEAEPTTTG
jgi:5S rRNA maturation endonuclease (ribonuclease M5)